jgi:hypothetical protein
MNHLARRTLFWAPRILTIAFAAFLSIFALDVFNGARGPAQTALSLLMHLTPTLVILLVLALAWRRERIAAIAFAALGALYLAWAWGRFPISVYFAIAGPLFVMSALFYANWFRRSELRGAG